MDKNPVFLALIVLSTSSPAFADCPAQMTMYEDGSSCVGSQRRWYLGWDAIPQPCGSYAQVDTKINRIPFFSAQWPAWAPAGSYFTGPIAAGMCILAPGGWQYRAWSEVNLDVNNRLWTSANHPLPHMPCDHSD